MLACARLGAPHSVVFGGFSAEALHSRIDDAQAKVVITADGGYRRGAPSALKPAVDAALDHGDTSVEHVLVVRRTGQDTAWERPRRLVARGPREGRADARGPGLRGRAPALHPLHVRHDREAEGHLPHDGWLPHAGRLHERRRARRARDTDVYWCTADIGWVTGHSYIVYGPLTNGVTQVMYEGTPTPRTRSWWEIVQDYKVTILYTAPRRCAPS